MTIGKCRESANTVCVWLAIIVLIVLIGLSFLVFYCARSTQATIDTANGPYNYTCCGITVLQSGSVCADMVATRGENPQFIVIKKDCVTHASHDVLRALTEPCWSCMGTETDVAIANKDYLTGNVTFFYIFFYILSGMMITLEIIVSAVGFWAFRTSKRRIQRVDDPPTLPPIYGAVSQQPNGNQSS